VGLHHEVDGGGAAEELTTRLSYDVVIESGLGGGFEGPVVVGTV
jgi:hypothetical protein